MKQLMIGILLLASLAACSEEDDGFVDPRRLPPAGTASFLLNGELFTVPPRGGYWGCSDDRLAMNFGYRNKNEFARISLGVSNFPAQLGKHVLRRRYIGQSECATNLIYASLNTSIDDGDVAGPSFHIVEEAGNNELIVTHYDSATRQIEGHFQMTFAGPGPFYIDDLYFPDTLRITYGTFSLKLNEPDSE